MFFLQFFLLSPQPAPNAVVFMVLALPAERLLAALLDVILSVSSGAFQHLFVATSAHAVALGLVGLAVAFHGVND